MYYAEDEHFARRLQTELQAYENFQRHKESIAGKENLSPIDSKLEYIDPTPSIHDLFVKFDKKFFWNTLGMVQVLWSNKMTKCAGMCSFEGGRGLCKISLSAPLLSLRPRKDLVETLLHEMIHAYLFVTHNYKDREDHGPEFHKHMFRINQIAGTKITVYHTFYDEVEYYQRHIWRCNGPCQNKKPYFGFVKRAVNRAPGPSDTWWDRHQKECTGVFVKISEPEKKNKIIRQTKVITSDKNRDIRDFFTDKKTLETNSKNQGDCKPSNIKTLTDFKNKNVISGIKTNAGTATVVVTNPDKGRKSKSKSKSPRNQNPKKGSVISGKSSQNVGNSANIKDLLKNVNHSKNSDKYLRKNLESNEVRETVRNIWASKFSTSKSPHENLPDEPDPKKLRLEYDKHFSLENQTNPQKDKNELKSATSNCTEKPAEMKQCPVCNEDVPQSGINDHLENCLSCSFENESDGDFKNEIVCESVPCPCCYKWFQESAMNAHIDECLTLNMLKEEIMVAS